MSIKIDFVAWINKAALMYDCETVKEAIETAVREGANLSGADLRGADLYGANLRSADLYGAKFANKELWSIRPVLTLGPCGSFGRMTLVWFFADGSEPLIQCGCFTGGLAAFEVKIHDTHAGTFHEVEYMAMVQYIKTVREYQLKNMEVEE